jgi:transcription elongation factor GreA
MPNSFLTREGYQKLQDELDYLRTQKREEIANRLHEAMEGGELIENAEYEAAKNEQAFVEGRIKELEILLATAHIIEEKPSAGKIVQVGSCVTIQEEGSKLKEEYAIVGDLE